MAIQEKEFDSSFDLNAWKGILPFFRPYRKEYVRIMAGITGGAIIDVLLPLFQRYAIDNFIGQEQTEGLSSFGGAYVVLILFQAFFVVYQARASMRVEMNIARDLRKAQFVHLQKLSLSFFNVTPVGYLLARSMNDTSRISGLIGWTVPDLVWATLYMLGSFIAMLFLNWKLAILVLLVVPVIALFTGYFRGGRGGGGAGGRGG